MDFPESIPYHNRRKQLHCFPNLSKEDPAMTPTTTSPETKRSLEPGRRMIIFGGNDSTLAQFRRAGERYDFVNVGDAKRMKELPAKNFDYAVVNGKVPDFLPNIIAMADRAGAKEIIVVEDGGHITKMMMSYPKGLKGVVTFDITGVTQVIPLGSRPSSGPMSKPSAIRRQRPLPNRPRSPKSFARRSSTCSSP